MSLRKQLVWIGLALALANYLVPAYGAKAHMYRCVDANGRAYYSDRPGTECENGQHDSLTRQGIVLDRIESGTGARPGESIEQTRKRRAQERYDRALRATYSSEEQIEAAKQRSLQTPMLAVKWGKKKLGIYRERLAELKQREAALTENKRPIPDVLKEDIVAAESDVARLERDLTTKEQSVDRIVARYEADKERYRKIRPAQRSR